MALGLLAAHKNLLRLHKDDARAAQVRIDRNKKDLEIVRRRLALQRDRSEDLERQARERRKVNVYRLRSKFAAPLNYVELVEFPEDKYVDLLARQETTPVLVTIWDAKRLWWYLNRFWWDSEGLDASDVQALILHRELEPSSQDEQV